VLIAKYADHTPLYRQAQIYARQGITLDRSTAADWVGCAASMTKLFADETTAPVLAVVRAERGVDPGWLRDVLRAVKAAT
jgi:transposase